MLAKSRIRLRSAKELDHAAIRRLIRQARINPTGLDWRRFIVAVDEAGQVLGCGQLKPHRSGVTEMASIAVEEEHRGQGIAHLIIDRLVAGGPRPLYITCRSDLGSLYQEWGFVEMTADEMPPYFRGLSRLISALIGVLGNDERLLVMVLK